ncbi:N-acetylmuramidase family protein [Vibrio aquimaris]|uniref:N-acetylmuramidase domain-containing protein n=1 Tax=Vibrio aquimaris TaxID=2587862 RepID=A0A5P9CQN1_9VIBR|nr:N-acetylmuramidase family protein [Vibrio aquimaris]QFT28530.1 hypothetical protein FIV01_19210 [Vibrio aquimaris]
MTSVSIQNSVGNKAYNSPEDVKKIQTMLNSLANKIHLKPLLAIDGKIKDNLELSPTCQAIGLFQTSVLCFKKPDYRVDVNGKTHKQLNCMCTDKVSSLFLPSIEPALGLSQQDYLLASKALDCDIAAIKAVSEVESNGSGFLRSLRPKILFEAHQFSKYTQRVFDDSYPNLSSKAWNPSLYNGGESEYLRLQQAMELDRYAALMSTSFGRYQIMGFNHQAAGYDNIEAYVRDVFLSEANHLRAFTNFIKSNVTLLDAIQTHNWSQFALHYNGSGFAQNHYDEKLAAAYNKYCAE